MKQTRFIPIEECNLQVREDANGQPSRTVVGHPIVYGVRSVNLTPWSDTRVVFEILEPGCITQDVFDRSDVIYNNNHSTRIEDMIGRCYKGKGTLSIKPGERNVEISCDYPNTTVGNDTLEQIRLGNVFGMSFAFRDDWEDTENGVSYERTNETIDGKEVWLRHVKRIIELYDVANVTHPAYEQTDVATREQFAVIMHRYALHKNYNVTKTADLNNFTDLTLINEYAVESIKWAVANNIISGTSDTSISPKDFVQRCQVAAILKRFCSQYKPEIKNNENTASPAAPTANNSTKNNSGGGLSNSGGSVKKTPPPISEDDSDDNKNPQSATIETDTANAKPGETISIDLNLKQNPGILGMVLSLEYDETAMKLISVSNGEAVNDVLSLTTSKELKSGVRFLWDGLDLQADQVKDGTLLRLEFEILNDAVIGNKYPLTLTYNDGDIVDADLNELNLQIRQGYIEIKEGGY